MLARTFSAGFALMAAAACTQVPVSAPINIGSPFETRGATSVSYDTAAVPAQPRYTPAPTYIPQPQVIAPTPIYRPAPAPAYSAPAPRTVIAAPAPVAAPAYTAQAPQTIVAAPAPTPAPTYTAPPVSVAPAPAVVEIPAEELRALTVRERVAALSEPAPQPLSRSTGRQFRAIEVAATNPRQSDPFEAPRATDAPAPRGAQITTADPFSISTSTTGRPYYEGSTPPAIEYFIPHIPQEEPLWCWAAAAQQAIGWVNNGRAPAQCAIVALAHGIDVEECCNDREGVCARTGEIPAIEKLVERFGGQGEELATVPRDPETIYKILKGGDTLLIRIRPAPHDQAVGIRHMIVVRGIEWLRLPNNQLQATLLYNDPLGAGERAVNFDEIKGFFEQALVISRT